MKMKGYFDDLDKKMENRIKALDTKFTGTFNDMKTVKERIERRTEGRSEGRAE